jgi:hypothetical protein
MNAELMPSKITRESFTAAMREAVQLRGADWRYPLDDPDWTNYRGTCLYVKKDGTPACIIGQALAILGHTPPTSTKRASCVLDRWFGVTDLALRKAATSAQRLQDKGATWGEALEASEKRLVEERA